MWPLACPQTQGVFVLFNVVHGRATPALELHDCPLDECRRLFDSGDSLHSDGRCRKLTFCWLRAACALALIAGVLPLLPVSSAQDGNGEYRAKAGLLAAFPNFIEWPTDAFPSEQAPIFICVFGDFSFGTSLAEMTRGMFIRSRRVQVRWARKKQDLRACHILFVSRSEDKRYATIFKAIRGASVLTVGETPDFLASGGAIDFLFEGDKLQFEVNIGAANEARLRISSNMLVLARHVLVKAEAAKS